MRNAQMKVESCPSNVSVMAVPTEDLPKKINIRSEDILGVKWDRCVSDTLIKVGAGFAVGAVASLILFRRRKWPLLVGTGAGLGMGLSNCQHSLNNAFKDK
ncbi:hypothetical protein CHUAL_009098 [Chamberlinius hualienensis]